MRTRGIEQVCKAAITLIYAYMIHASIYRHFLVVRKAIIDATKYRPPFTQGTATKGAGVY
ncbi:MAG: hypothetical protein NVS2B2_17530 [Ktedonobacteraceae bacterium]